MRWDLLIRTAGRATLIGGLAALLMLGASGSGASAHGSRALLDRTAVRGGPELAADRHLYVSDDEKGAVFEFPLVNGIPSQKPDATLNVPSAAGVAIGTDGELYVADDNCCDQKLFVFAPGARTGARPIRVLRLDGSPTHIIVDGANYLYAIVDSTYVEVFAPFARGSAKPLQKFAVPGGALDFALGSDGRLFVLSTGEPIFIYRNPIADPDRVERVFATPYESNFWWVLTVARDEVYVRFEPRVGGRFMGSDFAVLDIVRGEPQPDRLILTAACYEPYPGLYGSTAAITVVGPYLYQSCNTPNAVFVFDALHGGRQRPISTLSGMFIATYDVHVGP